jgi:hypothetical protein
MPLDERALFNDKPETRQGRYQCPKCHRTCGKKFEIPSQHSLVFVDQLEGLPNDEELEREINVASGEPEAEPERKPALPARFTRKPTGWK